MLATMLGILAQTQTSFKTTTSSGDGGLLGGLFGLVCCCGMFIFLLPMIAGMWKTFAKAGEPGWAALIPIYNVIVLLKIAGHPPVRVIFWMIPIVGIYFQIVDTLDFVRSYGRDIGTLLLLLLMPLIGWPVLGFGSAQYVGPAAGGGARPGARR